MFGFATVSNVEKITGCTEPSLEYLVSFFL